MSSRHLRPSSQVSATNMGFTGAATLWEALRDDPGVGNGPDTQSGYPWGYGPASGPASNPANPTDFIMELEDYTILATERVKQVRVWASLLNGIGGYQPGIWSMDFREGAGTARGAYAVNWDSSGDVFPASFEGFRQVGPWVTTKAAGGSWDQAAINTLRFHGAAQSAYGWGSRTWGDVGVELDMRHAATATITNPTLDVLRGPNPTVGWVYNDPDFADPQKGFRVKIFTKAVAEAGGFDPAVAATVYDSGNVSGSDLSHLVTTALTRGSEYYAYVQVNKDYNGTDWWGAWSTGVRFKIDSLPTTTVTTPVTPVTSSSRPIVTMTFADTDGQTKYSHQVRIFSAAQYGIGGFNPETSPATYDSGEVVTSTLTQTPSIDLTNGTTYRAYVRVRSNGIPSGAPSSVTGIAREWSAWQYIQFVMNLTPPPVPLLTATQDALNARVVLTLTHQSGAVVPEYYDIEKSLDSSLTWQPVRNLASIVAAAHGTVQVYYDWEAPFNKQTLYRAKSTDTSLGQPVSSYSTTQAVTLAVGRVWLKDISNTGKNITIPVNDDWHPITRRRQRATREPLGRTRPVILRGTQTGSAHSVTFTVIGRAQYDALMYFLLGDKTFLYQDAKRNIWVEVAGDVTENEHLWDELTGETAAWLITVPLIEVDGI